MPLNINIPKYTSKDLPIMLASMFVLTLIRQYWLLQHFKGWYIETKQACFQPDSATLMDFRAEQNRGTAFFYVLPFSATKALVEYTLFSPNLLAENEYDEALKKLY